jgi:hypothetical protein
MSSVMPVGGHSLAGAPDANVWASGAATAAFDAFDSFDDHPHSQVVDPDQPVVHDVVPGAAPGSGPPMDFDLGSDVPILASAQESAVHLAEPVIDDVPVVDTGSEDHWVHVIDDQFHHQDDPGLDLFT